MEYYSAIKINEIMSCAEQWVEMVITMLSEISQTQKDKYQTWHVAQAMHGGSCLYS
jgi:hypothetical protein